MTIYTLGISILKRYISGQKKNDKKTFRTLANEDDSNSLLQQATRMYPNFECCGGTLHDLDDGHVPETFREKGKWIHYPEMELHPQVFVYDNVLPTSIVNDLYQKTVSSGQPWGSYVTMDQVYEYWRKQEQQEQSSSPSSTSTTTIDDPIVVAVGYFLQTMGEGHGGVTTTTTTAQIPIVETYSLSSSLTTPCCRCCFQNTHGVAVWGLSSSAAEGHVVQYHMDYAELIRYESNIVAAPLWAGTLQCTYDKIEGGEFAVNTNGVQHYQLHGYKGKFSQNSMGGWSRSSRPSSSSNETITTTNDVLWNKETGWITIPYKYNRMIRHSGHLPHVSASFTTSNNEEKTTTTRRVIIGFNVFRTDVGPYVQQAPEHSQAFRRRIRLARLSSSLATTTSTTGMINNNNNNTVITLSKCQENKTLRKLLVLAKRNKMKQAYKHLVETLDQELEQRITNTTTNGGMLVQTLVEEITSSINKDTAEATTCLLWPIGNVDVQVHIQRRVKEGKFICTTKQVTPESIIYKKTGGEMPSS
jgi:hypothetical protein